MNYDNYPEWYKVYSERTMKQVNKLSETNCNTRLIELNYEEVKTGKVEVEEYIKDSETLLAEKIKNDEKLDKLYIERVKNERKAENEYLQSLINKMHDKVTSAIAS